MAKQAGPLTLAIRQLLNESKGSITHSEARPRLEAQGLDVATEPGPNSPEFAQVQKATKEYDIDWSDAQSVMSVANAVGLKLTESEAKRVIKEYNLHKAFDAEVNHFNVTKHNWGKNRAPSHKPKWSGKRAKTAAQRQQKKKRGPGRPKGSKNKPKNEPVVVSMGRTRKLKTVPSVNDLDEITALRYVQDHDGLPNVQAELDEARKRAAYLERVVELFGNLESTVSEAKAAKKAKGAA